MGMIGKTKVFNGVEYMAVEADKHFICDRRQCDIADYCDRMNTVECLTPAGEPWESYVFKRVEKEDKQLKDK